MRQCHRVSVCSFPLSWTGGIDNGHVYNLKDWLTRVKIHATIFIFSRALQFCLHYERFEFFSEGIAAPAKILLFDWLFLNMQLCVVKRRCNFRRTDFLLSPFWLDLAVVRKQGVVAKKENNRVETETTLASCWHIIIPFFCSITAGDGVNLYCSNRCQNVSALHLEMLNTRWEILSLFVRGSCADTYV